MKKVLLLVLACVFLFSAPLMAQDNWYYLNQCTIAWDAVSADADGDPFPDGTAVEYEVWLANADTDPNKANPVKVATTSGTETIITLNTKGRYFVGVKAILVMADETRFESAFNWADEPAFQEDVGTWAIMNRIDLDPPRNARMK